MGIPYGKYFPMDEYYKYKIEPLSSRFKRKKGNKRVCPFHNDDAPSMGIITNDDGTEIFHCFGCGAKGNVVMLHKFIEKEYHDRNISDTTAIRELCELFNVDFKEVTTEEQRSLEKKIKENQTFTELDTEEMTNRDYIYKFNKGRQLGYGIEYYNELLISLIKSNKNLED